MEDRIKRGWQIEKTPHARTMPYAVLLPTGAVVILNGAGSGISGYGNLRDRVGMSNADNPVLAPVLYENRATVVNARVTRGHTVLITGIGGGVALLALNLCLALGARVYVTSCSEVNIARVVALGAAGGVNYKQSQYRFSHPHDNHHDVVLRFRLEGWSMTLKMLP